MMRLVNFLLILVLLGGCSSTPERNIVTPLDDNRWIYGTGEATTLESADQAALRAIAGKLNTRISSSLERVTQQTTTQHSDRVKRQVYSKIEEVSLSNFERVQTAEIGGSVQVLVRVDRIALARRWQEELRQQRGMVERLIENKQDLSRFQWWYKANGLIKTADQYDSTALLLLSIDPETTPTADLKETLLRAIHDQSQQITTHIKGDQSQLSEGIKSQVIGKGLRYGHCKTQCELEIKYSTNISYLSHFDQTVAKLVFKGVLSDAQGELSELSWQVSGASVLGKQDAKRAALFIAENKINNEGIWIAFGIEHKLKE